jgi:hypothetical protein
MSEPVPAGWDRTSRRLCAALALVMLASLPLLVQPFYEISDRRTTSMYIPSAKALLAGEARPRPAVHRAAAGRIGDAGAAVAARGLDFAAMHLLVSLWGSRARCASSPGSARAWDRGWRRRSRACLWLNPDTSTSATR